MSGSKYKDIMKKGWHPEKSGTTFKGQVKGLVGRGKSDDTDRSNHVSVPISQLKDPSSFAPPPRRTGSGLIPAAPKTESAPRKVLTSPSNYQDPRAPAIQEPVYAEPQEDFEEQTQPRGPYRTNTTGLSTDNLPKPPGRRDGADGRPAQPPSYQSAMAGVGGGRSAPPSLPPRLPPRTNSGSTVSSSPAPSPAPTGSGLLNQGAVNRLGAAGISVPGFGIGRSSPAADASPSPPPPPRPGVVSPPPAPAASHMNELQNRFSKLGTSSNTNAAASPPPSEGTTWAQKQAALKTASSFQKDPSSVSFSDARAAASTANNFRQRHGEQVAAGAKKANSLNQKYGLLDKAQSSYSSFQGNQSQVQGEGATTGAASPGLAGVVGKKKPPPPPPKKKPALIGGSATPTDDEPPPIPMATRPQF